MSTKINLCHALCSFIPEKTKVKDGSPYPRATLMMIVSIQCHLVGNGLNWKLIDGTEFAKVKTVLDNRMKEHVQNNIGTVKR